MKALVVLSHLMTRNLALDPESVARAELAISKFSSNEYDVLVTSGWAYRQDCTTAIADVVKNYIVERSDIDTKFIISLTQARDTVGDAVFCLDFFSNVKAKEIHIITSDYHVDRTRIIFNSIFNSKITCRVFGVSTSIDRDSLVFQHEVRSLQEFYKTFQGVDFSSLRSIHEALRTKHPFYNGDVYPAIEFNH
jgi:uncharacterized SAM-binding protein YcdF (DUF218 family)